MPDEEDDPLAMAVHVLVSWHNGDIDLNQPETIVRIRQSIQVVAEDWRVRRETGSSTQLEKLDRAASLASFLAGYKIKLEEAQIPPDIINALLVQMHLAQLNTGAFSA